MNLPIFIGKTSSLTEEFLSLMPTIIVLKVKKLTPSFMGHLWYWLLLNFVLILILLEIRSLQVSLGHHQMKHLLACYVTLLLNLQLIMGMSESQYWPFKQLLELLLGVVTMVVAITKNIVINARTTTGLTIHNIGATNGMESFLALPKWSIHMLHPMQQMGPRPRTTP